MTMIELNIADDLARRATDAGLLTPERLQALLSAALDKQDKLTELRQMMDRASSSAEPEMPMDQINAIVKEVRRERREREAATS